MSPAEIWVRSNQGGQLPEVFSRETVFAAFEAGRAELYGMHAKRKVHLDLLTDVDWLSEVISDSIDLDWTPADAARAIVWRSNAEIAA